VRFHLSQKLHRRLSTSPFPGSRKSGPNRIRVLGQSPRSHAVGLSHGVGAATPLAAGCYVFGVVPPSCSTGDAAKNAPRYLDVLLDTAISTKTIVFTSVPWVFNLKGFMKVTVLNNESDEARKARITGMVAIESEFQGVWCIYQCGMYQMGQASSSWSSDAP
jgi:hypothetical protein